MPKTNKYQFGLIGYPLSHSFSQQFFKNWFLRHNIPNATYINLEFGTLYQAIEHIKHQKLNGFNITIPYKESILPFLHHISDEAKAIGAVNCVKIINDEWHGYNTDCIGFEKSLLDVIPDLPKMALVLGNGGAAKAIIYVLNKLEIEHKVINRHNKNGETLYQDIDSNCFENTLLIINTTPLGMFPYLENFPPIPYHLLNKNHILFDLIYNPSETLFLKNGVIQDCKISNGLKMLEYQAIESWKIWAD